MRCTTSVSDPECGGTAKPWSFGRNRLLLALTLPRTLGIQPAVCPDRVLHLQFLDFEGSPPGRAGNFGGHATPEAAASGYQQTAPSGRKAKTSKVFI